MKVIPIHNDVLVIPKHLKKITTGGIYNPNVDRETPFAYGEVVVVGQGVTKVSIGDVVMHDKYGGTVVNHMDKEVVMINEKLIMAKVEAENTFE